MKKNSLFLLTMLLTVQVYGQDDIEPINAGAANFLTIPADAQTAAMGGASVAVTGKNNAIFYNAATSLMDEYRNGGVTYTYSPWMRDYQSGYSLHTVGGYTKINSRNALLAGYRYYNMPRIHPVDAESGMIGDFRPQEMAFEVGYAREIIYGLNASATVRYIRSDMGKAHGAKSAHAVAFDIGAVYRGVITGMDGATWTAGLQVSNLGTKIKYLETEESLPAMAKVGGAVDLPFSSVHRLLVTAEGGYRMMPSDVTAFSAGVGAEYTIIDIIMLRGGYHYGDKKKADNSYASAGAGVKYYGAQVDFAWLFAEKDSPVRNSFLITAGFAF